MGCGKHDYELIPALSRHRIFLAQADIHARRHLLQQLVAGLVAMTIIDRLELIEIDKQNCHAVVVACSTAERLLETIGEKAAIWQAGQFVVIGASPYDFLSSFSRRDVADHCHMPPPKGGRPCRSH